jgi:7-cyano-7-deazaguanine reductase
MTDDKAGAPKHLGTGRTDIRYDKPDLEILDTFPSPFSEGNGVEVEVEAQEFTTLCPVTGQPDFAHFFITYRPNKLCVESKSLKLYFGAFRMYKGFHEECVNRVADDLIKLLDPLMLKVEGRFTPRGGIKICPVVTYTRK